MQNYNFFKIHYPSSILVDKVNVPKILCNLVNSQNLFVECGSAGGENLILFKNCNFKGKLVSFDLWERIPQPDISNVTMIKGNVLDTLKTYSFTNIDILYLDLDQDSISTKYTLDFLVDKVSNAYIYLDEFLGQTTHIDDVLDSMVLSKWLIYSNYQFEIPFYTEWGAVIKIGSGHEPSHLLDSLEKFYN